MHIPAMFKLERKSMIPIITVTGVADPIPGIESVLMAKAIQIIDAAQKYKGVLMVISEQENMMVEIPRGKTAVKFNIIFKNEEEYRKGVEGLQRELG